MSEVVFWGGQILMGLLGVFLFASNLRKRKRGDALSSILGSAGFIIAGIIVHAIGSWLFRAEVFFDYAVGGLLTLVVVFLWFTRNINYDERE